MCESRVFPEPLGDRFAVAYERALAEPGPVDGVILDLRGNVGGDWVHCAS